MTIAGSSLAFTSPISTAAHYRAVPLKKGADDYAAFYYAQRFDLLSFSKRCTDSWRHHFLPDLLLFLLLLLLSKHSASGGLAHDAEWTIPASDVPIGNK